MSGDWNCFHIKGNLETEVTVWGKILPVSNDEYIRIMIVFRFIIQIDQHSKCIFPQVGIKWKWWNNMAWYYIKLVATSRIFAISSRCHVFFTKIIFFIYPLWDICDQRRPITENISFILVSANLSCGVVAPYKKGEQLDGKLFNFIRNTFIGLVSALNVNKQLQCLSLHWVLCWRFRVGVQGGT